jgi:hypothetical protein
VIDEAWFALHNEYLHTPEWHARRKAVLTVAPDGRLGIIERAARYGLPIVGPHEVAS